MPLGGSKSISYEGAAQFALVELTPLEWNSETPERGGWGADPAPHQLCSTWVGRWCSTAIAISGPETNIMQVKIW